jgi:hypothetical protein
MTFDRLLHTKKMRRVFFNSDLNPSEFPQNFAVNCRFIYHHV